MQILVETRSVSFAESVRLALLSEGIEAMILDQASVATLGLAGSIRVVVPDHTDLARASEIVAGLQPPKTPPLASWWWHKRAIVTFLVGLVLARLATDVEDSMRLANGVLTGSSALCIIGAIVLMVLGYRADSRTSTASAVRSDDST